MEGFTYLGTIDDMVAKYPWRFRVTTESLAHSLVIQLIDGRPVLLNDGYLVLHPLGRDALLDKSSHLWELIKAGFVRVMARGGYNYSLAEMPERMARQGIESYRHIVDDQVPGVVWRDLRAALDALDTTLRKSGFLVAWPTYDTGTGFRVLSEEMRSKNSTTRTLGLSRHVRSHVIPGFLEEFIDKIGEDSGKPRSVWEHMVKRYANKPDNTNDPREFRRSMMNLANEMYHYNMGVMLSAELRVPVAVETQASAAFDDLLVTKHTFLEESDIYRLRVPRALTSVDPLRLVKILEVGSSVFEARNAWIAHRSAAGSRTQPLTREDRAKLEDSGKRYASALAKLVGMHVRYDEAEGLFNYVIGAAVKSELTPFLAAAGSAALTLAGVPPAAAGAVAIASGYVVHRLQKTVLSGVSKKVKIALLPGQLIPPAMIRRSSQIIRRISARQTPSSIELSPSVSMALASRMERFKAHEQCSQ